MSASYFQFRQFTIHHDRCAMKVGTDGVLVGAWGEVPASRCEATTPPRILDVGTGTGLIALMAAQRCPTAHILGIDIDTSAVQQARENVAASPFAERVDIRQCSLQELAAEEGTASGGPFDCILCNPPFFEETLLPPDAQRSQARHTTTLPFPTLVADVRRLLKGDGTFSLILPTPAFTPFRHLCFSHGLVCTRLCHVQTTPSKVPKRTLATFAMSATDIAAETTLILNHGTARTAEYSALTRDFYLW